MRACMQLKNTNVFSTILCILLCLVLRPGISFAQDPSKREKDAIAQEKLSNWKVLATSPGVKILSQTWQEPGKMLPTGENPLDVAQNWLFDRDLVEGRNMFKSKMLYVSIGAASVNAKPSDPDFIESRLLAFQRAELEAKAKTAIFIGVDLTTERGSSEREINPEERAALKGIVEASPDLQKNADQLGVKTTIYDLFEKTKRLADAKLDKALKDTGVDIDAEKKEAKRHRSVKEVRREQIQRLRTISESSMKAAAGTFADVQGTQVIQSFEGSYHDNYQVVVITLWSHNLQRLVDSMRKGTAPSGLPPKKAKAEITKQLPKDPNEMACLTGVRAYINQEGEHVLLAFGQAGIEVIGGRKDKAYELAGKKARLRAMAAMRTFMGEKVAFSATEELMEVLALYSSEYQTDEGAHEYHSISQFQEKIDTISRKQKITGIQGLLTKELVHPFTDKPMVLKVMSWSPSSQAMAQELKRTIKHGVDKPVAPKSKAQPKKETPARKGVISSGQGADKDAW